MVDRITMKDVASSAGVSQAAVSYAYGRPDKLSQAQVERILGVARDLGYPGPSQVGASLRSGRTGAIGVMVMDSLSYAFSDPSTVLLLQGLGEHAGSETSELTVIPLAPQDSRGAAEQAGMRGLVDGIVVHSLPDDHPALHALRARGVPLVVVDAPRLSGVPMVRIEDRSSARLVMRHLLDQGHTRVGVLADRLVPDGRRGVVDEARMAAGTERVARERLLGYLDEGPGQIVTIVEAGGFDGASGQAAAAYLLEHHDVTAIAATSDVLALNCLDELADPRWDKRSVAVAGFDDTPAAAARGLTTIRQPLLAKGRVAARMLHQLIAGATDVADVVLPTELIVRTTTPPPPQHPSTTRASTR